MRIRAQVEPIGVRRRTRGVAHLSSAGHCPEPNAEHRQGPLVLRWQRREPSRRLLRLPGLSGPGSQGTCRSPFQKASFETTDLLQPWPEQAARTHGDAAYVAAAPMDRPCGIYGGGTSGRLADACPGGRCLAWVVTGEQPATQAGTRLPSGADLPTAAQPPVRHRPYPRRPKCPLRSP